MKLNNKGTFTDVRLSIIIVSIIAAFMIGSIDFVQPTYRNTLLLKVTETVATNWFQSVCLWFQKIFASTPSVVSGIFTLFAVFGTMLLLWKILSFILSKIVKSTNENIQ